MTPSSFWTASEVCWPPLNKKSIGPWIIREGEGGGNRVSSTTANDCFTKKDIFLAENHMSLLNQENIFHIRQKDSELDYILEGLGYSLVDKPLVYGSKIAKMSPPCVPPMTVFNIWPPLRIMKDIWKIGGTTDSRMAVMARCKVRKTAILGRIENKVAGCAFISEYKGIAILQSLFVLPNYRRKGLAGFIISESVKWASYKESSYLALMTDKYNKEARGLYDSLGMTVIDNYHYRVK